MEILQLVRVHLLSSLQVNMFSTMLFFQISGNVCIFPSKKCNTKMHLGTIHIAAASPKNRKYRHYYLVSIKNRKCITQTFPPPYITPFSSTVVEIRKTAWQHHLSNFRYYNKKSIASSINENQMQLTPPSQPKQQQPEQRAVIHWFIAT